MLAMSMAIPVASMLRAFIGRVSSVRSALNATLQSALPTYTQPLFGGDDLAADRFSLIMSDRSDFQ
jgi:hypothetical protein